MIEGPRPPMLLTLLHLCDSLFPTGAFAHSDGLEAATSCGSIGCAADLGRWMDAVLDESLARTDGPAVLLAWQACVEARWDDLQALDAELHALRPSSTARTASRAMGTRLLTSWREIHPQGVADDPAGVGQSGGARARSLTLPVAFGFVCASARIGAREAVAGFIYTRLAATASSAMRLMAIGQREAHALLAATLARAPAALDAVERSVALGERPGGFAPALDLAAMGQQYVRSRLFLS